jgi:hypothetical protein
MQHPRRRRGRACAACRPASWRGLIVARRGKIATYGPVVDCGVRRRGRVSIPYILARDKWSVDTEGTLVSALWLISQQADRPFLLFSVGDAAER